ncbi:hypothetical protein FD724_39255 (plasmid) [Nostoc sp. C057]|uniref:hypothetical protein n=1 Tax=Nostoc sp. C057 TaxID=2576903 RepID=UPI0015C35C77|nr:hypothetical protein [Nostoc sp. C057]QLE53863.1 hypothetical protein FD724_39255 [Nostoc sp. C057]
MENTLLNEGQREVVVELAATTSDQFIAWQGVAGAGGKLFALKELKSGSQGDADYRYYWLRP